MPTGLPDDIEIVDPHVHIGHRSSGAYRDRAGSQSRIGDYVLDDLLREAQGLNLVKAVHVEAFPVDGVVEARHVALMAENTGTIPIGIVAFCNLSAPDAESKLEDLAAIGKVRGIRQVLDRQVEHLSGAVAGLLENRQWHRNFGRLKAFDFSFDLQLQPEQAGAAARLARENPETRIVVDHLGNFADRSAAGLLRWREGLRRLAEQDNVCIKLSGLAMYDPNWTVGSARPFVLEAIDAFTPQRSMFASNFPIDRRNKTYRDLWASFLEIVKDFTPAEKRRLFRESAEAFYRI